MSTTPSLEKLSMSRGALTFRRIVRVNHAHS
jgi:hypothetical protein